MGVFAGRGRAGRNGGGVASILKFRGEALPRARFCVGECDRAFFEKKSGTERSYVGGRDCPICRWVSEASAGLDRQPHEEEEESYAGIN